MWVMACLRFCDSRAFGALGATPFRLGLSQPFPGDGVGGGEEQDDAVQTSIRRDRLRGVRASLRTASQRGERNEKGMGVPQAVHHPGVGGHELAPFLFRQGHVKAVVDADPRS